MSDIATENYKKSVTTAITRWSGKIKGVADKLVKLDVEIAELEAKKPPSDDDKKQLEEKKKEYKKLRQQIETANTELRIELMVIEPPKPTKSNEGDLKALPEFIKKIIKEKAVPLGKGVTIKPDVDFDFKAVKLKGFGLTITWRF